ncbi:MAG: FliM/FliN family flagellar motor switch protein [Kofleriaceae bacterium]
MPRLTRREAAFETVVAQWIAARRLGAHVAKLAGGPVHVRLVGHARGSFDPHPALAEVRIGGQSIVLAAASAPVRALAQRVLGGPVELAAPRPPTPVEHAIWALAIAAAIEDTGVAAEVWPLAESPVRETLALELAVDVAGTAMTVVARCPLELAVRVPPARAVPAWPIDVPIVVARCALARAAVRALAVGDVVVVERGLGLELGNGTIGLQAADAAVEATVATGYVARDMTLPDEADLELTVQLGTTRMTLRQIAELAIGQVVALGRPLAGPYEIRAAGRPVGQGELVDVDGELGVRIVSLLEE